MVELDSWILHIQNFKQFEQYVTSGCYETVCHVDLFKMYKNAKNTENMTSIGNEDKLEQSQETHSQKSKNTDLSLYQFKY